MVADRWLVVFWVVGRDRRRAGNGRARSESGRRCEEGGSKDAGGAHHQQ